MISQNCSKICAAKNILFSLISISLFTSFALVASESVLAQTKPFAQQREQMPLLDILGKICCMGQASALDFIKSCTERFYLTEELVLQMQKDLNKHRAELDAKPYYQGKNELVEEYTIMGFKLEIFLEAAKERDAYDKFQRSGADSVPFKFIERVLELTLARFKVFENELKATPEFQGKEARLREIMLVSAGIERQLLAARGV